jgi:hypothetical protein
MRLTAFNGSPRGAAGNTARMLEQFLAGFDSVPGNISETLVLASAKDTDEPLRAFAQAESALLAFPLYVDAMPAAVKAFIEGLEPFCGRKENPPLLFFVHSGFPEASHSRPVERYLEGLAKRLGCQYRGTVIKPGSEGVRHMPEAMNRKLFGRLRELGRIYGSEGRLDKSIAGRTSSPERLGPAQVALYGLLNLLGLTNRYWDGMLKRNGAFDKRYDQPYLDRK